MSAARLIPWIVHELLEYVAGVFLILAPFLFFTEQLTETVAFPLFVAVGVLLVLLQLLTPGKAAIAELLPLRVHATLDYLLALFLVVSPFVFGLTANGEPEAALFLPILLGVALLVVSLVTRYPIAEPAGAADAAATSDAASGDAASGDVASGDAEPSATAPESDPEDVDGSEPPS